MEHLSLTMPCAKGDSRRLLAVGAAALCSTVGVGLAIALLAMWPLALSGAAALTLVWLLHTAPLVRHIAYFSADEDGMRYVHLLDGTVSRQRWTEVREVRARLAGAGGPGLDVLSGHGAAASSVFWPMPTDADCLAASAAATGWLSAYRV